MTLLTNKRKLDRILKLIREVKSSLYNPIRLFVKVMIIKLLRKEYFNKVVCRCSNTCYSFNRFLSCCIHTRVRLLTYLPQGEIKLSQQQIMARLNVSNSDSIHLYCMIFFYCSIKFSTFIMFYLYCINFHFCIV